MYNKDLPKVNSNFTAYMKSSGNNITGRNTSVPNNSALDKNINDISGLDINRVTETDEGNTERSPNEISMVDCQQMTN